MFPAATAMDKGYLNKFSYISEGELAGTYPAPLLVKTTSFLL